MSERERRRNSISRMLKGITPIVRPEQVTYDDEPETVELVPFGPFADIPVGTSHGLTMEGAIGIRRRRLLQEQWGVSRE